MEGLEAEARINEVTRQPVQQFGMGGPVSGAEIVEGLDDTALEVLVPDAIDSGASELHLFRACDPVCQDLATARAGRDRGSCAA